MTRGTIVLLGAALLAGCDIGHTDTASVEVNDVNFAEEVLCSRQPVMVDFWAEWCPPCRALGPTVHELAAEYQGRAVVAKLNIDDNPDTARKYKIRGIPTLLFFNRGKIVARFVGGRPKAELAAKLDSLLKDARRIAAAQ